MSSAPPIKSDPPPAAEPPGYRPLSFDADKYRKYLDKMDLSEAQKTEVLETLWSIMSHFVDLGFGVKSSLLVSPPRTDKASEWEAGAVKNPAL